MYVRGKSEGDRASTFGASATCSSCGGDERLFRLDWEWFIQIIILNKLSDVSVDASLEKLLAFSRA